MLFRSSRNSHDPVQKAERIRLIRSVSVSIIPFLPWV